MASAPRAVTAVVVADADGMICYWNRGVAAVLVTPAEGDPRLFDL